VEVIGDPHAPAVSLPEKDRTVSVEQEAAWALELISKFLRTEKSPVPAESWTQTAQGLASLRNLQRYSDWLIFRQFSSIRMEYVSPLTVCC
jgi:hypothetical protein